MLIAIVPVVFILLGGAIYVFAQNPKFSEIGRLLLAAGAFALAFAVSGKTVSL